MRITVTPWATSQLCVVSGKETLPALCSVSEKIVTKGLNFVRYQCLY